MTTGPDSGQSVTTNQTGYSAFSALRSGTFTIGASASGYVDATRSVALTTNTEVDLTSRRCGSAPNHTR